MNEPKRYDVVVIGGGVSGSALFYTLAKYTNVPKVALIEKYEQVAQVNSKGNNNSQTLHIGDIETNYSLKKAESVKPAAMMVPTYVKRLLPDEQKKILFKVQKMVLAVGKEEVDELEKRYEEIKNLYPDLQKLDREEIEKKEPSVVRGRGEVEPLLALFTPDGMAVDFEQLALSFIKEVKNSRQSGADLFLGHEVKKIEKIEEGYRIITPKNIFEAKVVIVNADSYSLLFAKSLGYGKKYSLIPVAGSFYFTGNVLKGKVYTMQDKKLPFAAVHGDPDVQVAEGTRWGPTAKFFPVLESRKLATSYDYFRSAGLFRYCTAKSFLKILSDATRFKYLLKNASYDLPIIGKRLFLSNIKKIAPSVRAKDLRIAKGYGGMRLQRVNTETHELELGEGKIMGDNIIFNMTPSPGATVCLFNGMRDAELVMDFLKHKYSFDKSAMEKECAGGYPCETKEDISENFYPS